MRAFLIFFVFVMGFNGWAADPAFQPHGSTDSMVRFLTQNGFEKSDEPSLLPSEVYARMPDADRRALLKTILQAVLKLFPAKDGGLAALIQASFGPNAVDLRQLQQLAQSNDLALEFVARSLYEYLRADPTMLDRFPTLPLAQMNGLQEILLSMGTYNAHPPAPVPFRRGYPEDAHWADVQLKTNGCTRPTDVKTGVYPKYGIYIGQEPVARYTVPCFAQNSEKLTQLVNGLTNTVGDGAQSVAGSISYDQSKINTLPVRSFADLTQAFDRLGLTVEVYNSRMIVDFLGWLYKDHGTYKTIRLATWMQVDLGNRTLVRAPAEHGELSFIVRQRDGQRVAALKWYFGIPLKGFEGMSTFWRPQTYLQPSWSRYLNEFVRVLPPGQASGLLPYLNASAQVMRGFQAIYDRYQPPANGYGLFVCSDSMLVALTRLAEMQPPLPQNRLSNAFPTLYSTAVRTTLEGQPGLAHFDQLLAQYAGIKVEDLARLAPRDQDLQANPQGMRARLNATFERSDDRRLEAFSDFRNGDLEIIRDRN